MPLPEGLGPWRHALSARARLSLQEEHANGVGSPFSFGAWRRA